MTTKLLFLIALIPLLVLAPSLSYASVTAEQDKCIQDKMNQASGRIGLMILINTPQDASTVSSHNRLRI